MMIGIERDEEDDDERISYDDRARHSVMLQSAAVSVSACRLSCMHG